MQILQTFTSGPEPCPYLPDRQATLEYVLVGQLSAAEYEERLHSGWRKFGNLLFRPVCPTCDACRPVRIPVADFAPSRAQQRCLRRSQDLTVTFGAPVADARRAALFTRYQAAQQIRHDWAPDAATTKSYFSRFVQNPIPAAEIAVWDHDDLVAVALFDVTPNVVSAVYHFWEPAAAARSPGTFVILQGIELARRLGRSWVHLGYHVADCPSLSYKATFRPNQLSDRSGQWISSLLIGANPGDG